MLKTLIAESVLTSTHVLCFGTKIRKKMVYLCQPQFCHMKVGYKGVYFSLTCFPGVSKKLPYIVFCILSSPIQLPSKRGGLRYMKFTLGSVHAPIFFNIMHIACLVHDHFISNTDFLLTT